jgi:hypothetical protein
MAQFNIVTDSYRDQTTKLFEVNMLATANGHQVNEYNRYPVELSAGSSDAFGRLRISEPFTLGDYKHLYAIDPNFVDVLSNGGTITHYPNQACARLATTSNASSSVVHQTKFYHHYMPGKSQLIKSTFNFYAATTNVTKRTGYFDDKNGMFFEQAGDGTLSFCIRTYVSGTASDARKVTQANWNKDKCDGTGSSGFTLDISKTQILFIDFQWLGVGRVRMGFVHNGNFIIAHEFYNSNNLDTVYMSNPNLPVRCEIRNTGTTTGAYLDQICSTVISEGGYVEAGQDWAVSSPSLRTITSANTVPVLAIRLANTYHTYDNRMIARSGSINLLTTAENINWKLIKLPNSANLTGGSWVSVHQNSGVEYNATATSYTGGEELDNGYLAGQSQGAKSVGSTMTPNSPSAAKKNYIVQNFDSSNSEIYVVVVKNLGTSNTDVGVGWQWREIY